MGNRFSYYFRRYFELLVWSGGLVMLAFMDPGTSSQSSLCLFHQLGISACPGCGLGHSISLLFHGNIIASFQSHPFGIPAVAILLHRIYTIINTKKQPFQFKSKAHGHI